MIKETEIISLAKYQISGGIHPQEFKSISNQKAIEYLPIAKQFILAIPHSIDEKQLRISVGDNVSLGQKILLLDDNRFTANIYSPCDGKLMVLSDCNLGHLSGLSMPTVTIKPSPEKVDNSKQNSRSEVNNDWRNISANELIQKIYNAGIVGMGGAVFPTHIKLTNSVNRVKTLIVNAMECEPYITCDDRLLREHSAEVLQGALIAAKIVSAEKILFGIEDNKPEAIIFLEKEIIDYQKNVDIDRLKIEIIVTKTKYPSGGEKQLIQILTGLEVPQNKYPASLGIIVQNVATLYAINDAICCDKTLTHRLITITGDLVKQAGNYWVAFGTSLSHVISTLEINPEKIFAIILGGPLMGQTVFDLNIPTQKSTNCIIFNENAKDKASSELNKNHTECIRCSECESACPVNLLPQQLYWFSKSEQWDELETQNLFDCIECGACSYVCPSEIPLVNYYRFAKSEIKHLKAKQVQSEIAKMRFENRENRLARIKTEREKKRRRTAEARKLATERLTTKEKEQDPDGKKSAIEAALERVKVKKEDRS